MTIFGGAQINNPGNLGARTFQPRGGGAVLSWWNPDGATPAGVCIGAYQAKSVASYAASKVNLPTPGTFDLTEKNGAVSWAAGTGWQFTGGLNQCFDTGISPVTGTWSVLIQFANVSTTSSILFGLYASAAISFIIYPRHSNIRVRYYSGGTSNVIPSLPTGNLGMAGKQGYRNGAVDGGAISAGGGATAVTVFIGAFSTAVGAGSGWLTGDVESFAIYNSALAAPQMLARATAMALL